MALLPSPCLAVSWAQAGVGPYQQSRLVVRAPICPLRCLGIGLGPHPSAGCAPRLVGFSCSATAALKLSTTVDGMALRSHTSRLTLCPRLCCSLLPNQGTQPFCFVPSPSLFLFNLLSTTTFSKTEGKKQNKTVNGER